MRYIVADTETTGLGPDMKMVEAAWCEIGEDLGVISEYSTLINPEIDIPCDAAALHGIRNEDVYDAPLEQDVPWPSSDCVNEGFILIAHNAKFDLPLLSPYMNIVDTCCTLILARRLLPDAPNHKLGTLSCYCDLERQLSHRALGDVRSTLALLDYLVEGSGKSIQELIAWSKKPMFLSKMPFGKHQGMLLKDLPKSYVAWLMQQSLDEDLRISLERVWG